MEQFPNRPALEIDRQQWTYEALWRQASLIADKILANDPDGKKPVALFATKSLTAYAGVLGIWLAGRPYVPMNVKYPPARTLRMLRMAGCEVCLLSDEFSEYFRAIEGDIQHACRMIAVENEARFHPDEYNNSVDHWTSENLCAADVAYIMFTSGTTGEPKGIPVSHGNLSAYVEYVLDKYNINEEDRISQTFDLTFDLSVHDMFVCWAAGACLCPLSYNDIMFPTHFINRKSLSVWFSVPSVANRMAQVRMLKPASLPSLRLSFFCGEALLAEVANAWTVAAANSRVINLYGPTEVTIAVAEYEWERREAEHTTSNGIVPIGRTFPRHSYQIVSATMSPVPPGEEGELLVNGPQVTNGYLHDEANTKDKFIEIPGSEGKWYRTGDRVRQDENGILHFLGRVDHQVKMRGYRIELGEIEALLRGVDGIAEGVVLPVEDGDGIVQGLRAFVVIADEGDVVKRALQLCREALPEYMVPTQIIAVDQLPTNENGKIDRKKLAMMG